VGALGSIPGRLFISVVFAVLVSLRLSSLALGSAKPEAAEREEVKVIAMPKTRAILATTLETAWALGMSILAGLPLLT
jgi:hypothetical protein